jgi:hypothetical protein
MDIEGRAHRDGQQIVNAPPAAIRIGVVISGYRAAAGDGCTVIVKLDGDGQMDAALIPDFVGPIVDGEADYTKGNRFFSPETIRKMPWTRFLGNAGLSFFAKASSGYWRLFDPTNGFTAIHAALLAHIDLDKVERRYFFESDMLFRLGTVRACVVDIPMVAVYGDEKSGLRTHRVIWPFLRKHLRNLGKRIAYNYFIRDFSLASLLLAFSVVFLLFGVIYGGVVWTRSVWTGAAASIGNVMAPALSVIIAMNLFLSFLAYDLASTPTTPIHRLLARRRDRVAPAGEQAPAAAEGSRSGGPGVSDRQDRRAG